MSFWELLIIIVIGLLVIGPDQLPGALRNGMLWFGRIKRSLSEARGELEKQLGVDEIRRELHNEDIMRSLKEIERGKALIEDAKRQLDEELARETRVIEHSADDPVPPHDANPELGSDVSATKEEANHSAPAATAPVKPVE